MVVGCTGGIWDMEYVGRIWEYGMWYVGAAGATGRIYNERACVACIVPAGGERERI